MVIFAVLTVFDCFWPLVHRWYSLGRPVTIGTPMVLSVFDHWYSVPFVLTIGTVYHSSKTVKRQSKLQKSPLVYQSSHVYQDCTNSLPIVKNSQKTVKQQKMTIGVPIVTCLHRVRRLPKAAQTPLPCETSITCSWAVATARRPWAGLTVCVYMDVHGPCVWLPFAAVCCCTLFYLLMMPAARLVCQRPSSNFPYFRTQFANFLLSRPNSVEYGNSKTTTLLPSAKMYASTLPRSNWLRRASIRLAWYRHMPASSFYLFFLWPPYSPALVNGGSRKFYTW